MFIYDCCVSVVNNISYALGSIKNGVSRVVSAAFGALQKLNPFSDKFFFAKKIKDVDNEAVKKTADKVKQVIAYKLDLITKAGILFQKQIFEKPKAEKPEKKDKNNKNKIVKQKTLKAIHVAPSVHKEVTEFFQTTLAKLAKGENAPIPRWYHSTQFENVGKITESRKLIMSKPKLGEGVYLSSVPETKGYGPFTFTFDEQDIEDADAEFFNALNTKTEDDKVNYIKESIWVRVKQDVPLNPKSMAYIVTDDWDRFKYYKQEIYNKWHKLPKEDPNVEHPFRCVSKQASILISNAIAQSEPKREIPQKWTEKRDNELIKEKLNLPKNMVHISVK